MNVVKTIRDYLDKTENSDKHINKYISNAKKLVGNKTCVIGHLHKYVKNDNIEIVDTYMKGVKYIINDKYLVISDTHITNESPDTYIERLIEDLLLYRHDKIIILLGDILDFWISDGNEMKNNDKIKELIDIINRNSNIIYVRGNHDYDINSYFDVNTVDKYESDVVVFYHGHQFDDFFNSNIFGKVFLWIQLKFGDNVFKFNRWLKGKFYTE